MNKVDKSQVLVLSILTLLLLITPLLPSFLKPTYLYFIFNILIIALGAEAGLLSAFSDPSSSSSSSENRKQPLSSTPKQEPEEKETYTTNIENKTKVVKVVEKAVVSEKIIEVVKAKKCSSVPSIFFIGSEEEDEVIDEEFEGEVDERENGVNGQELFAKAEAFIGNFYKQLKMQRENSWVSHKAY